MKIKDIKIGDTLYKCTKCISQFCWVLVLGKVDKPFLKKVYMALHIKMTWSIYHEKLIALSFPTCEVCNKYIKEFPIEELLLL